MRTRTVSRWLVLLVVVVLFSGCGLPGGLAVSVERQLSNIVFGEPTAPKPAPSPVAIPSPLPGGNDVLFQGGDIGIFTPFTRKVAAPNYICPTAAPGAAAADVAQANIDNPPRAGNYKWLASYVDYNSSNIPTAASAGFEERKIENVSPVTTSPSQFSSNPIKKFTFDSVQPDPDLSGGTVVTFFKVQTWSDINQNAALYNNNLDPNDGVAIYEIKRFDPSGKLIDDFLPTETYEAYANPNTQSAGGYPNGSLLLFTLPEPGSQNPPYYWDFTAVDHQHQWSIEVHGSTTGHRQFVDACGQVVEGWPVEADVTINRVDVNNGKTYTNLLQHWSYVVATQYGGIIIGMQVTGSTYTGTIKTNEKLGSLDFLSSPPQ